jgi:hypothetical protein
MFLVGRRICFVVLFALAFVNVCFGGEAQMSKKMYDRYKILFNNSGARRGRLHAIEYKGQLHYFLLLSTREIIFITSEDVEKGGFRGAPKLALRLSPHGDLQKIIMLETPDDNGHVRRVIRAFDGLEGQNIRNRSDRPVLAVSGATFTSSGVTMTVNSALDMFLKLYEDMELGRRGLLYKKQVLPSLHSFINQE